MAMAKITFEKALINDQQIGSASDHFLSRVFFTVEVGNKVHSCEVEIKQVVGADFGPDSVEVSRPTCEVPLSYNEFRAAVEGYYRRVVESIFRSVKVEAGSVTKFVNCWSNLRDSATVPLTGK